jgi:hypothetical protein
MWLLLVPVATAAWGGGAVGHAASAFLPGLSADEAGRVEEVPDEALAEMRGRYAGYYFSTDMSGYWDSLGNQNAQLHTNTNISEAPASPLQGPSVELSDPSITAVQIHAFVGSISNTSGMIQITQVPGSNNVITSVMNLKIMVINVIDGGANIPKLLPQLAGF